jgi:L-threonylcarbamoyladenylate synthase
MPPAPRIVRPEAPQVAHAAALIRAGGLVAFPTETVYGLGGDATNEAAVRAIYAAKGRPSHNPMIIHCADADAALRQVQASQQARRLAARFWPGRLLAAADRPLAAPSANRSGAVSPTTARHVADSLGDAVDLILDGGPCPIGVESTVLDLSEASPRLLRPGAVPVEAIEAEIGPILRAAVGATEAAPRSPGLLARHYAPERPMRLEVTAVRPDEALIAFGPHAPTGAALTLNLSPSGDLEEAAHNLYAMLRRADRPDLRGIAVMPIPDVGLGLAINDRLHRAAAPK